MTIKNFHQSKEVVVDKIKNFVVDNEEYEFKVIQRENIYIYQSFHMGQPVGTTFSLSFDQVFDLTSQFGQDVFEQLFEIAKNHIERNKEQQ